jgi:hypothetical protein
MELLIILFGFASLAGAAVFVLSLVVGTGLCMTRRFRTVGVFVLLVPTTSAATAFAGSWGLAFLCESASKTAASLETSQQWTNRAFWAWPIGFVLGAVVGGLVGALLSSTILGRRRSLSA